jgi:hypothetical protein
LRKDQWTSVDNARHYPLVLDPTIMGMTVGYFKCEQEKIRQHTDIDVPFTLEYSRVSISMGNVKCTRRIRNIQGKGNYRVERVFRVF